MRRWANFVARPLILVILTVFNNFKPLTNVLLPLRSDSITFSELIFGYFQAKHMFGGFEEQKVPSGQHYLRFIEQPAGYWTIHS